jgi:hypothetical protein
MCQLGTFLQITNKTMDLYNMILIDDTHGPAYQRMASHITFEPYARKPSYEDRARNCMLGGMCRALGNTLLPECNSTAGESARAHVAEVTFNYAFYGKDVFTRRTQNAARLRDHVRMFRDCELTTSPGAWTTPTLMQSGWV